MRLLSSDVRGSTNAVAPLMSYWLSELRSGSDPSNAVMRGDRCHESAWQTVNAPISMSLRLARAGCTKTQRRERYFRLWIDGSARVQQHCSESLSLQCLLCRFLPPVKTGSVGDIMALETLQARLNQVFTLSQETSCHYRALVFTDWNTMLSCFSAP